MFLLVFSLELYDRWLWPSARMLICRSFIQALIFVGFPIAAIAQAPALKMALGTTKPPYIFAESYSGFEYDLIEHIVSGMGYRLEAQFVPNNRAIYLFENRQVDGLASIRTVPGSHGFESQPYIVYRNVAISLADRHLRIDNISDLSQYRIAAFQPARINLGAEYEAAIAKSPYYIEVSPQVVENRLLYSRRVDVVITDPMIFRYLSKESAPQPAPGITIHSIFKPSHYVAVFQTAELRDKFNTSLRKTLSSDFYARLMEKYMAPVDVSGKISLKPEGQN